MKEIIYLQGRELLPADITTIRKLIADNPSWSRRKLSEQLCRLWDWRNAKGVLKDMAARTLMLKLDQRAYIKLPPRRRTPSNRMTHRCIKAVPHETTPFNGKLCEIQPIKLINICLDKAQGPLYAHLLAQYHYLSYTSTVGENMKYLFVSNDGVPLGCFLFGSSAWACKSRDCHIGWKAEVRKKNINYTTNNTRFLILPWINVLNLASHVLAKVAKRINADWEQKYGHSIFLLETFVDSSRFFGGCYKAANWQSVGHTQGRTRNDKNNTITVPTKEILLYPLKPHFKTILQEPVSHDAY